MPRASKRKAAPSNSSSVTSSPPPAYRKSKKKEVQKIDALFDRYANASLDMIDPDGIEALCSDMKVQHTDVRILMFAWKLKAQRQGYFTRDEWQTGLMALQVDSLKKLKESIYEMEREVTEEKFQDFYSFAFQYCLTEEKQKSVDVESTCELLNLVLGSRFRPKVDLLIEYLKIQRDYKVINRDQWMNIFRFFKEINFSDLENYDAAQAWPLILDNFVDWMKEKQS